MRRWTGREAGGYFNSDAHLPPEEAWSGAPVPADGVNLPDPFAEMPSTDATDAMPDKIAAISAWRSWRLGPNFRLRSVVTSSDDTWPLTEPYRAECRGTNAPPPKTIELFAGSRYDRVTGIHTVPFGGASLILPASVKAKSVTVRTHFPPEQNCSCGIYAHKDRNWILANYGSYDVVGAVSLWGKIIEGERGYRAEYARPEILAARSDYAVGALQAYGVPVIRFEQLEAHVAGR